ncbi:LLM class flavin-dependent oxidoreductase [Actinoplanes sp. NPDC049118]|uniref:LLM class flavin-dependent oxidoreductase n=1 Tax=Actinoplanes sp. NPDC049118 TaxID=3155769 RepID=UPI0033F65C2E
MTVFGFGLDHTGDLLAQAVLADRYGLDLVGVADHPYFADRPDAYATIGVVLGRTGAVSGLVNVSNLPTRPAPMLARMITGLSALTGGRVVLGLGAGGLLAEAAKLGVPLLSPAEAVRALQEAIQVVRALSGGGEKVTFEGEFYRVTDLAPAAVPTPRIWTGSVGPRSLAVTGRHADGWIPGHAADWLSPRYLRSRPVIDEAAAAAGRDPADIATVYNLPGRITPGPLRVTRDASGVWIGGSAGQWVEELTGAVLAHGAGGFTYFPADDGTPVETALGRWAREVVPEVRAAVAAATAAAP